MGPNFAERCGREVEEDPEAGACRKSGQDRDASRQADADRNPQDRDDVASDEQAVALFVVLDVVARVVNVVVVVDDKSRPDSDVPEEERAARP